jgi:ABC-type multidrug transport system fused ATPase/permease subunit
MHRLPEPDPGVPDSRSANRYLLWLARKQWTSLSLGVLWGVIWMVSQALMPAAIGKTLDAGVTSKDTGALVLWSGAVLLLGMTAGATGILRHRCAVTNYLAAAYRTVQLTSRQAARLGATLPSRIATGDVVAIGTSDVSTIGGAMDVTARGAGAVVSIIVIAVLLLAADLRIGLTVLLGVPAVMALMGPLFKPMLKRQSTVRDLQGRLTGRANDIVAGLRVLRGIGGEPEFAERYQAESQKLRHAGVQVARVESVLESAQVLLPGLFVVGVTWLGARLAVTGDITPGQLVAFYGYAAFLVMPLRTLTELSNRYLKAKVAAGKVIKVLSLEHDLLDGSVPGAGAGASASGPGVLADSRTGLTLSPGVFTAVAAADPQEAIALADRLGHYAAEAEGVVTLDGVPLGELPLTDVRRRVLVADNDARLFAGVLAEELAPTGAPTDPAARAAALATALHTAAAEDIIEALPNGLDTRVAERGRSFSGGQQQRLRLARALMADPETLLLVEPTSAVDAHTEARVAERLVRARAGRTTVVMTTSPLMLDRAERVAFLKEGRIVAEGTHRALLAGDPAYRATVTREED